MASAPHPEHLTRRARQARGLDAVGLLIVGAMAAWTLVAAAGRPHAEPGPVLALLAAMVLLAVVGRRIHQPPGLIPGMVAVAVGGALLLGFPALLRAGGAPTGYANSNADLAALGVIAAAAASALAATTRDRRAWAGLSLLLAVATVATGSMAASLALGVAAVLALLSIVTREALPAVAGGVVAVSLLLGVTAAIAAGGDPLGLRSHDDIRPELWARALEQVREQPLRGVGPAASAPPTPVTFDADLRWAHHGYLQQAAEAGVVGLLLLLTLVGWGYLRLAVGPPRRRARTVAGASALTVVALHASVDHILHAAAVPLTLALLVGWATASPRPTATIDTVGG